MVKNRDSDKRETTRVPVKLRVDYKCKDNFLFEFSSNLSQNGIFVTTNKPLDPGTRLDVQFKLEADMSDAHTVNALGEVIWVNIPKDKKGKALDGQVGMGIRFLNLDELSKDKIKALVKRIAVL
ncbi:MAG: TIGR02266 family protein [Pseudomonadota bacterium]